MSEYTIRPVQDSDAERVMAVLNHYVKNSFAAYPSTELDTGLFVKLRAAGGPFPFLGLIAPDGELVGFGQIRPYHFADSLMHTAEASLFILPDHCRHGQGTALLKELVARGKEKGVRVLLGSACSLNEASLAFQKHNGFVACGRFVGVGQKFGRDFDIIWMQKFLD